MRLHVIGAVVLCATSLVAQRAEDLQRLSARTGVTFVLMDVRSGRTIAQAGRSTEASAPGSILKPLFLLHALQQGTVTPATSIFCKRSLRGAGRDLQCTHPQNNTLFTAKDALAYSCNTYFAAVADRSQASDLMATLRRYGLDTLREPHTPDEKRLLVLGLSQVRINPVQAAEMYRRLALQLQRPSPAGDVVSTGLRESVEFGMAHNADAPHVRLAGKTGTASDPGQAWTHGWFAGIVGEGQPQKILVVYVPRGNGADAATFARKALLLGASK